MNRRIKPGSHIPPAHRDPVLQAANIGVILLLTILFCIAALGAIYWVWG